MIDKVKAYSELHLGKLRERLPPLNALSAAAEGSLRPIYSEMHQILSSFVEEVDQAFIAARALDLDGRRPLVGTLEQSYQNLRTVMDGAALRLFPPVDDSRQIEDETLRSGRVLGALQRLIFGFRAAQS